MSSLKERLLSRGSPAVKPGGRQDQRGLAGSPATRVPVFSSPRRGGMERFGRSLAGSIKRSTTPPGGAMTNSEGASGCVWSGPSPHSARAADLAVAQAVVDEGEQLAGGRHPARRSCPAGRRPGGGRPGWQWRPAGGRRPRTPRPRPGLSPSSGGRSDPRGTLQTLWATSRGR